MILDMALLVTFNKVLNSLNIGNGKKLAKIILKYFIDENYIDGINSIECYKMIISLGKVKTGHD